MTLMKTTNWMVVAANGNTATFTTRRKAEKIAKELREGRTGNRQHAAPVGAKVVAV